jgi:hypothetical protein
LVPDDGNEQRVRIVTVRNLPLVESFEGAKPFNETPDKPDDAIEQAESRDRRLCIRISDREHKVVDRAIQALHRSSVPYVQGASLVEVLYNEPAADRDWSGPLIHPLKHLRIRDLLTEVARFENRYKLRSGGTEWRVAHPPDWCPKMVHARGQWPALRRLAGVTEAPSLRPDGSVIQRPGYDRETGYLYIPNDEFPRVPDRPSHDDAMRALETLREVFQDFPFASEADRSVSLACVLTLIARPAIRGPVPAFIFGASTAGSGKGLLADCCGTIATGRTPAKMGFSHDEVEREKVLAAYALNGCPCICFDNVTGSFGSAALDRCLTADNTVGLRPLGKSEIRELPWRAVVLVTGNNLDVVGDTSRRVLRSTLEPPEERPEEREGFAHHPLLPWVAKRRPLLVVAALTLLRAFVVAGRPKQPGVKAWGSFEEWSSLVPQALVWAGATDPMLTRPALDPGNDPKRLAAIELLSQWDRIRGAGPKTAAEVIGELYPPNRFDMNTGPVHTAARAAIETLMPRSKAGKQPDSVSLGHALKQLRRRNLGGMMFDSDPNRKGIAVWFVCAAAGLGAGDAGDAGDVLAVTQARYQSEPYVDVGGTSPATSAAPAAARAGVRS